MANPHKTAGSMPRETTGGFTASSSGKAIAGSSLTQRASGALQKTMGAGKGISRRISNYSDIDAGVPAASLREIEGLTRDDIRMIIADRTLERRIADNAPLKIEEADGIARLLRVLAHARRVFADHALADEWLHSRNPALGDVPMRMARTDLGGREVEAVLGRMEHGVFG